MVLLGTSIALGLLLVGAVIALVILARRAAGLQKRFAGIIDVDAEIRTKRRLAAEEIIRAHAVAEDLLAQTRHESQRLRTQAQLECERLRAEARAATTER